MNLSLPIRSAQSRVVWRTASAALLIGAVTVAGCASSTPPVAYQQLPSAPLLRRVKDSAEPFQYRSVTADLRGYSKLVVDPVTIYGGPDAQFGSVSQEDRQIVADYMRRTFIEVLGKRYRIVAAPEPGAARLHLTLTGLETSTPVLSTVSHVVPLGLVANGVLEAKGDNGTFFGSVSYAAELFDASTGDLLRAYVRKETPGALDVTASVGTLDAARSGVRMGARQLRDELTRDGMPAAMPQPARAEATPVE
jgi:hypothetical protein